MHPAIDVPAWEVKMGTLRSRTVTVWPNHRIATEGVVLCPWRGPKRQRSCTGLSGSQTRKPGGGLLSECDGLTSIVLSRFGVNDTLIVLPESMSCSKSVSWTGDKKATRP